MDTAMQNEVPLSPRLQRAMEAAKARGLVVEICDSTALGVWIRISTDASAPGTSLSLFDGGHPMHIASVQTHTEVPDALVEKAQTWAEHARVILAAADGVQALSLGTRECIVTDDGHGRAMVGGRRLAYGSCGVGISATVAFAGDGPSFLPVGTRVRVEFRDGCDFATLVEVLP